MNLDLTDEQREIQSVVRDFAQREIAPVAEELDREKRFPYEIVAQLGELGVMGVPIPEEWGGAGADTLSYALAIEELATVDSSVAVTVAAHTSLGAWPIYAFGTDEQRGEWLPDLCGGRKLAAFGLTEPGTGSDTRAIRTSARLEDGEWVVDGAKQFITNAGTDISGCVNLMAKTGPDEISMLLVAAGTPGYSFGGQYRKMGWHASDTRPLTFDSCRVPEGNLLGARGRGLHQCLEALDGGRIGVAAMGVGLANGALHEALEYARERRAFGRPVSSFGTIRAKLAEVATEVEAARLLTHRAALLKDAGRPYTLAAAQAKLKASRLAVRAADAAVQIHGGAGYMEEYPVCRFYRDAKVLTIAEGTDEVLEQVIARGLGA
jgi:short/branched chain acyl-CoA dehydrogenase